MSKHDTRRSCCGMDPELERELLSLIREGKRPVEIIKRLREATGVSFRDCKRWVDEHMPKTVSPCPYCQAPLASSEAKQCFQCGYDWHDPNNIVRSGDPNWNRFGLNRDSTYVVELCQKPSGERYTKYREVEADELDPYCVLETEPALGSQFIEWGFYEYAKHLRLADGRAFVFEAHGIWMTQEEAEYRLRRVRGPLGQGEQPPWFNGIRPCLLPK